MNNYIHWIGLDRVVVVTDAISAARLGPGEHRLSGALVHVDADGVARRPGSQNLAGSTVTMPRVIENLTEHLKLSKSDVRRLVDANPRQLIATHRRRNA